MACAYRIEGGPESGLSRNMMRWTVPCILEPIDGQSTCCCGTTRGGLKTPTRGNQGLEPQPLGRSSRLLLIQDDSSARNPLVV